MIKKKKENQIKMKKIGKFLAVGLFLFLLTLNAWAETKVMAEIDRDQLSIGDAFTLILRIESDEDFEAPLPTLPKIQGVEEINSGVGSRQSSSSISNVGGKIQYLTKVIQDYQYLLSPQKEGVFIIPVIDISINGKTYKTQPIKFEVREEFRNSGRKKDQAGRRFPPGFGNDEAESEAENSPFGSGSAEDVFEEMLRRQQQLLGRGVQIFPPNRRPVPDEITSQNLNINTSDPFFVYLDLDKTEVYEGEQITANWYIYARSNIETLDRVKFPNLKGFWKEIIEEIPSLQFTEALVNGVRYRKALLASHALFPIKAGEAVIDEFRIKAKVRNLTQFGLGMAHTVTKASKATKIKVLPLPEEGRTQSFSGAVGSYRVSVKADATSYPANQPFSLKIRFEGIGNAKLIDLPAISWPEGLEVYDTKNEARFFKEGNSYKEFEVLVIPRKIGEMLIPSFNLTYFDPAQKKYVAQATEEIKLLITQSGEITHGEITKDSNQVSTTNTENSFIKPEPILILPEAQFSVSTYRLPIYLALFFLVTLLMGAKSLRDLFNIKTESEVFAAVENKIKNIDQLAQVKDFRKLGAESVNLIYLLVANLAGQKKADQELHILIKEISTRDQQKFLDRINMLFDYFQLLGFSPDEIMQNAMNKKPLIEQITDLKNLTKEIVDKLKKEDKNIS